MAKKEKLSPEDLLEQALVKEEDQPYAVPENWVWVKFKTLAREYTNFFDGDWILSENMDINGEVRLIQLSDIGICDFLDKSNKYISLEAFHKLNCREIYEGDLLISRMAEPIARSCILPNLNKKCITAVDVAVLRTYDMLTTNKFVNYLCNSEYFKISAEALARGTTRVRITRKNLGNIPIPLPPLPEQQRIVAIIESLFEKLDRAKEMAQSALDSFENRKSAILHKAFTGELTRKWREENGVDFERVWIEEDFDKIAFAIDPHPSHRTPSINENGIPYIGIAECNYDTKLINFDRARLVAQNVLSEHLERYTIKDGDFIIGKIGTVGKPFEIPSVQNYVLSANVVLIQAMEEIVKSKYLFYLFQSSKIERQFKDGIKATTQPAFGIQKVRKLKICYPSPSEQQEIVCILDNLLENEQKAKDICDVIVKIDHMKKSILARAFRGELGTNNPTEESALELLREVLKAKA